MSTTQTNPLTRKVKPSLEPGRHQDLQVDHLVLRGAAAAAAAQKIHRHDLQPALLPRLPAEQPGHTELTSAAIQMWAS